MSRIVYGCIFLVVLLHPHSGSGQTREPNLIPTEVTAARIGAIQDELSDALEADKARHERQLEGLKQIVTDFVIAQLEAEPEITGGQLRGQLIRILGGKDDGQSTEQPGRPPYAFRVDRVSQAAPIVWALAYQETAYYGFGGLRTIVESYVVESGKARMARRGGVEMNGYDLSARQIWNPLVNTTSVLTWGIAQWSSGHVLPAGAALYSVGPSGVEAVWKFAAPGLEPFTADGGQFSIQYHDEELHSQNLPSTVIDKYDIRGDNWAPIRTSHSIVP